MQPNIKQLTDWAQAHHDLALAVIAAQAFAKVERERVDAYIQPIFEKYTFHTSPEFGEVLPITRRDQLYLCDQKEHLAYYYAECNAAHRAHGWTGPEGYCPALVAEHEAVKAKNALLEAAGELMGCDFICCKTEHRNRALDLFLGACLKKAA